MLIFEIKMIEVIVIIAILMIISRRGLVGLSYDRLDNYLLRMENKFTTVGWSYLVAITLLLAAIIYIKPDTHCTYLGKHYASLAANPFIFDPDNPVSYRILTPLISYLIGLRGCSIIITNLIICIFFIANVYSYARTAFPRPGDALLTAAIITFSLTVLTTIHCGGYCDILTYMIVFLMWRYRSYRILFYLLFLLGLLNREAIAFLLPWFIFISLRDTNRRSIKTVELLIGFGFSLGVYYLFRQWVDANLNVTYSWSYYLEPFLKNPLGRFSYTYYYHSLGLFSVFKVLWVLPCLAVISMWRERKYADLAGIFLIFAGTYLQLFIAQDTSRMFTLGFMIMIISLHHLFEANCFALRKWIFPVLLFNLLIPPVYTAGRIVEVWQSLPGRIIDRSL